MGESSCSNIDVEKLISYGDGFGSSPTFFLSNISSIFSPTSKGSSSYSDDLVKVLRNQRDLNNISHTLQRTLSLSSTSHSDFNHLHSLLQDYQKKLDACNQKAEEARRETTTDAELDLLQRELEEELEKERLLKEEFRVISNEFNFLEQQWVSVQEQKKTSLKIEKDKLRAQMILSMYASVTNIVPNLDDQSKISGYIVEKDKNAVEKFEYDSSKIPALDVCNDIWNKISS